MVSLMPVSITTILRHHQVVNEGAGEHHLTR